VGPLSLRHGMSSGCRWREVLQIWGVAANILNKQSWTADKGWSSTLGVGHGANNPSVLKFLLLQNVSKCPGPGLILWHDQSNGKRAWDMVLGILGVPTG
jgi:hypothetical protein